MPHFPIPTHGASGRVLLALAIVLTSAFPAYASSFGDRVADAAREVRPSLPVRACNGLAEEVLRRAGFDEIHGNVRKHFAEAQGRGWLHHRKVPEPGDLVFFDRTYDSNKNGRQDDELSHIAVVISVDPDATVHMVHWGSAAIQPLVMNLKDPGTRRTEDGKVLNSYLGKPGYAKEGAILAGELWRAFATPDPGRDTLAMISEGAAKTPRKPPPSTLPVPVDDPTFVRLWQGRRLAASDLDGRSCLELWALRNAIFARHGLPFRGDARSVFAKIPEYRADPGLSQDDVMARLTGRDRRNLADILEREGRCNAQR
jgi:hypothetical protein